ncbi:MAG: hypothetical protein ABR568_19350 [Pyrinomonadaceae bacterium]
MQRTRNQHVSHARLVAGGGSCAALMPIVMLLLVMEDLKEIRAMWDDWKAMPFPGGYGGEEVAGICVTSLDTFTAGCIDTFISTGRLDSHRISVLVECRKELELVVKNCDGAAQLISRIFC